VGAIGHIDDVSFELEPGERAIVDKDSRIRAGASIGMIGGRRRRAYTISDNGIVVVPKGNERKPNRAIFFR